MTTLNELSDKVNEKLQTLTGTGNPLAVVYDYHTLNNNGQYPFVTFELEEGETEIQDTCNNIEYHTFGIYVYQEITKQGRSASKENLYNSVTEIIRMFEDDYTLGGVATAGTSQKWSFLSVVDSEGKLLLAKIDLLCKIQVNINN